MCLIIFSPNVQKTKIKRSVLERGFDKNGDGAGMAFIKNGVLEIVKTDHVLFNDFYAQYRQIRAGLKGPLLIHFRKLTKGSKNEVNTQPLAITPNLIMAHNGTIDPLIGEEDTSDSVQLTRLMPRLKWEFPFARAQIDLLTVVCNGKSERSPNRSKLVFLDVKGHYQIVNAGLGKWRAGAWYSDGCDCFDIPSWQRGGYRGYSAPTKLAAHVKEVKQTKIVGHFKPRTVRERELNEQWAKRLLEEGHVDAGGESFFPHYGTPIMNSDNYSS